jgi:hypothetical protein
LDTGFNQLSTDTHMSFKVTHKEFPFVF